MTRDYKDVPRASDAPKKRARPKKTASKTTSVSKADKPNKKPASVWLGVFAGLGIGLTVAVAIYINDRNEEVVAKVAQTVTDVINAVPDLPELPKLPEKELNAEIEEQRFDFYNLLPELEVIIPDSEIKQGQADLKPKEDVAFMIQAGSFRNYADAESLKAQLAFLGIEAAILQGDEWHRVRSGPYSDKRELNKVRNRMHRNDINTLLVRVKKESE